MFMELTAARFMDDEQDIIDSLIESTWEGKWDTVVDKYRKFPWIHIEEISESSGDTALHAAADSGREDIVDQLIKIILDYEKKSEGVTEEQTESSQQQQQPDEAQDNEITETEELQEKLEKRAKVKALEIQNENGDTPLHLAASKGFEKICKCIVGMEPSEVKNAKPGQESFARQYLLRIKNKHGETPLFLAALNWHKKAFVYLNDLGLGFVGPAELVRNNGDTILHCAIQREYFDLTIIILYYYDGYMGSINKDGNTPLTVLATKRSAFLSSSNLNWWDQIVYHCLPVESLDVEGALSQIRGPPVFEASYPKNWVTCCYLINFLLRIGGFTNCNEFRKENERDIEGEPGVAPPVHAIPPQPVDDAIPPPPVQATWRTCLEIITFVFVCLTGSLRIKIKKQKHLWGAQILNELMKQPSQSYRGESKDLSFPTPFPNKLADLDNKATSPTDPTNTEDSDKKETKLTEKKETALFVAARNGIVEIVNEILKEVPVTIQEKNWEKKNVLLVAVQNRQPRIVKALRKHPLWDNLILGVDEKDNTVLHLAAEALDENKPWKIPGSAMQMIWDMKWYEYIKSLVPPHFHLRSNKGNETPGEKFNMTHKGLVKESSEWLKDTSESCSVVAALIAAVSFATSSTVPGGTDSSTGKPALEGQPAFDLFAMSSLVSLCFSVTALIMFLSILTSRKQAKDFRRDLPLKILLGLSSLFVSIASMFISFCAGHFFVLRDKFKNTLFPIYASTCIPVTFYAVAQFPLYIDLLIAIVGKVPHPSDKGDDL